MAKFDTKKYADCIYTAKQMGADEAEARDIVEQMAREKGRIEKTSQAVENLDGMEEELAKAWASKVENMEMAALARKREAALTILKRMELENRLNTVKGEGFSFMDGLESILVGSYKRFFGARNSVDARRANIQEFTQGAVLNSLEKIGEKYGENIMKLIKHDKAFHDAIVNEIISPQSTKDAMAREVAEMFSGYLEVARQRANQAGANIGKIDGYVPQSHDPWKISETTGDGGSPRTSWVDFVQERLDVDRSFPDLAGKPDELREVLGEVYDSIVIGHDGQVSPAERGERILPRNMASGLNKHRVLHFKDGPAFLEYNERYGRGNVLDGISRHLEKMARTTALMETLGPNPQMMVESLIAKEMREIHDSPNLDATAKQKQIEALRKSFSPGVIRSGKVATWMAELTGETQWPLNTSAARAGSIARGIQTVSKLGMATLSSLADVYVKASAMRVNGESWGGAIVESLSHYFSLYKGDQRELARDLGFMIEGSLGDLNIRWDISENRPGVLSSMQNALFQWSGLNWFTEAGKAGQAMWFSNRMAKKANTPYAALDANTKAILDYHGITPERWGVMSKMVQEGEGGRAYLVPGKAQDLSDADLEGLLPDWAKTASDKVKSREFSRLRSELQTDAGSMIADETRFGVLEPDAKTRAFLFQGTRPGTAAGEIWRMIWQFKSFPIAYLQRVVEGRRWVRGERQMGMSYGANSWKTYADALSRDVPGLVGFALSSYVFGYLAMTMKDIAKGKMPRDPMKKESFLAALAQSGGLGIYGDFFLGQVNRFGNDFAGTLAGPVLGSVGDLVTAGGLAIRGDFQNAGEELINLVAAQTPFINMWYTKAAVDWLLLYHLREMMSPGSLARSERKMREEFGQEYIYSPAQHIQRGGFGFY